MAEKSWLEKELGKKVRSITPYKCDYGYDDLGNAELVKCFDGTEYLYCEIGRNDNCERKCKLKLI